MKIALTLMGVVACLHAAAGAEEATLKCYQCTDLADKSCVEDKVNLKACPDKTFKSCSKTYLGVLSIRACNILTEEKCDESLKTCFCTTDGCNAGHTLSPPSILGVVTLLLSTARGLLM